MQSGDVDAIVALLTDDALLTMPPSAALHERPSPGPTDWLVLTLAGDAIAAVTSFAHTALTALIRSR